MPQKINLSLISTKLEDNIEFIKEQIGNSSDLNIRLLQSSNLINYALIFINRMVDNDTLNSISSDLVELFKLQNFNDNNKKEDFFDLLNHLLLGGRSAKQDTNAEKLISFLLSGYIIILIDGCNCFLALKTTQSVGRNVEEPTSQAVIRGPKEGFIEKIDINIGLLRKKIKDKDLRVDSFTIGSVTKTSVALIHIENIAREEILKEIKSRLKQIEIDGILESGYIEELIKDDPYSVFPTLLNSERPDTVAAALLEGKIAIIVDGTPYVLIVPCVFSDFFQVSEDYYSGFFMASALRLLRYFSFFLTLLVPSLFIALTTFQQEMIPTPLLISIAAQRENIPFPAFIETLLMEVIFEILREASIRMPRAVGSAISIVGALVLGQAAVEAGIISAAVVIVVSVTAIASFVIPNYSMLNTVRILRFVFMVLASVFGLYGIFMGMLIFVLHLCKLKSMGIPYLTPFAPKIAGQNKDTFIRFPLWKLRYRPAFTANTNSPRTGEGHLKRTIDKRKREFR